MLGAMLWSPGIHQELASYEDGASLVRGGETAREKRETSGVTKWLFAAMMHVRERLLIFVGFRSTPAKKWKRGKKLKKHAIIITT